MRVPVAALAAVFALGFVVELRAEVLSIAELRGFGAETEARIRAAAEKVNKVFAARRFQELVKSRESWDHTKNDGVTVLRDILAQSHQVSIVGFRPRNPWSKVVASTVFGTAKIQLNTRTLGAWSVDDLAGTLAHELTHLTPESGSRRGYGHGSNSSVGKGASVPYGIGEIVRGWVFEAGEDESGRGESSQPMPEPAAGAKQPGPAEGGSADEPGSPTSSRWEPVEDQPKPARSAVGRFFARIGQGLRRLFGRVPAKSASSSGLTGAMREAGDEAGDEDE